MIYNAHTQSRRSPIRPQFLFLLCSWFSVPLGIRALFVSHRARAIAPESVAIPKTAPTFSAAPPKASTTPVDTFIDPPEPEWEPALPPAVPSVSEPTSITPKPLVQPEVPLVASPQPAPAVSPQMMPQVAENPETGQFSANTSTAPEIYSLDNPTKTASTPDSTQKTVLTGSVSGCQASLDIDPILAATLCGPRVVQTAQSPAASPNAQYNPVQTQQTYSYPQETAPRQTAYAPSPSLTSSAAPPPWAQEASSSLDLSAGSSPSLRFLSSSPNPLKWLVPNRQQTIFPLPIPAAITSAFGWRTHPISGTSSFHAGTDLAAPTGTPVLATLPGQVETAGFMGGYGLAILLQHQQGQLATRYAHLSKIYVQPGQWVSQGTIIGLVGSTGNSTGPHLHYETLKKEQNSLVAFDPEIQIKGSLAELIKALQTAKVPPKTKS